MKYLFLVAALTLGTTTLASAQQAAPANSSMASPAMPDSGLSAVYTDGKCHFRLNKVPGQGYNDGTYMFYANTSGNPNGWGFSFRCHAGASQDDIDGQVGAKLVDGKWVDENSGAPFDPDQQLKVYNFSGKNWTGKGIAYSQIYGDEARRQRFFNFCLTQNNGPQVLCGQEQVRNLNSPPSTSTLPKIMAVLKTIEFVEQAVNQPASSGSAGRSGN